MPLRVARRRRRPEPKTVGRFLAAFAVGCREVSASATADIPCRVGTRGRAPSQPKSAMDHTRQAATIVARRWPPNRAGTTQVQVVDGNL